MSDFKHTCGYGYADIQPECTCYEDWRKKRNKIMQEEQDLFSEIFKALEENLKRCEENEEWDKCISIRDGIEKVKNDPRYHKLNKE